MSISADFVAFHAANPGVYTLVQEYARQLIAAGRQRLSISLIVERVRWESAIRTIGDTFKINNNFSALYARKLEADYPEEFAGKFSMRVRNTI